MVHRTWVNFGLIFVNFGHAKVSIMETGTIATCRGWLLASLNPNQHSNATATEDPGLAEALNCIRNPDAVLAEVDQLVLA